MTGSFWWDLALGVAAALLFAWLALVLALVIARPRGDLLREALRVLPDVLRLLHRLAADKSLPRGVRVQLALLLAYLAIRPPVGFQNPATGFDRGFQAAASY